MKCFLPKMAPSCSWIAPPDVLTVTQDEVHVWRASLDIPDEQIEKLIKTLSPDERERSEKYHFRRDRQNYIAARGILRNILAGHLGTEPEKIIFSYSPYGKPFLSDHFSNTELSFNLSHAKDLAMYAVTLKRKVGIDIEYSQQEFQWNDIVERFFSPLEKAELLALPEKDRHRAFFTYWTRKEAFLKAKGIGLSTGIKDINVTLKNERSSYLLRSDYALREDDYWSLIDLNPGFGYLAALAVEGDGLRVRCWQYGANLQNLICNNGI
ncbi:MAG: 4'-phosphopantetheinyl transferase superfamily protein [Nitrospirae bacterium]|nr:4'-phosphopantetheinyl transferase superfamily protein [Nitrospirota bacterium]